MLPGAISAKKKAGDLILNDRQKKYKLYKDDRDDPVKIVRYTVDLGE